MSSIGPSQSILVTSVHIQFIFSKKTSKIADPSKDNSAQETNPFSEFPVSNSGSVLLTFLSMFCVNWKAKMILGAKSHYTGNLDSNLERQELTHSPSQTLQYQSRGFVQFITAL